MNGSDGFLFVRRAVRLAHAHAAQPNSRDFQVLSQFAFWQHISFSMLTSAMQMRFLGSLNSREPGLRFDAREGDHRLGA
jgi:hypothetical protein